MKTTNKVIADCGKNCSTMLKNGQVYTFSHKDFLDEILSLPRGTMFIAEEAHLTPRELLSKAQPFTKSQLDKLSAGCNEKGIKIRCFPQQSTPRALEYYRKKYSLNEEEFGKSDHNDLLAIKELLEDFPEIKLSHLGGDKNIRTKECGNEFQQLLNNHLNISRSQDYSDENDGCRKWVNQNIEELSSMLAEGSKEIFGLTDDCRFKIKAKKGQINIRNIRMTQLYSVVACLIYYDGTFRIRSTTNNLPGKYFIQKYVLKMTPFHRKGGVARSNLYHHGMKNFFRNKCAEHGLDNPKGGRGNFSKEQEKLFKKCRKQYRSAIFDLFQSCKKIVERQMS